MDGVEQVNSLAGPLILWIFGQIIPFIAAKGIDVLESQEYLQWAMIFGYALFYGTMGYFAAEAHEKVG